MNSLAKALARGTVFAASVVMLAAPVLAQNPPPPQEQARKKHHSGVGAGIAAGVLGGIAGAAIVGSQNRDAAPGDDYPPPPPPPPGPRYGAYADDDEPDCRIVRKPVYDEDGEVVSYKTRRVCR